MYERLPRYTFKTFLKSAKAVLITLAAIVVVGIIAFAVMMVIMDIRMTVNAPGNRAARAAAWERDIRHFERRLLQVHPVLTTNETWHVRYEAPPVLQSFHNAGLRDEFSSAVNSLIGRVTEINNTRLLLGMREAAAIAGGINTSVAMQGGAFYPFDIIHVEDGFYVWRILGEYEHLMYSELTAINGIGIDEIFERAKTAFPAENEYWVRRNSGILRQREFLAHIGVIDDRMNFDFITRTLQLFEIYNEPEAVFTFVDTGGEAHNVTFDLVGDFRGMVTNRDIGGLLMNRNPRLNYWFEFLPEESIMYVRFANASEMGYTTYTKFAGQITDAVNEIVRGGGAIDRFVIDVRGNGGGLMPPLSASARLLGQALEQGLLGGLYILIDNGTHSAGVGTAAVLRQLVDGAQLVGEPSGQPPNFFGGMSHFRLPVSRVGITSAAHFFEYWPSYEHNALRPDILINRTLEDLMANRDTVLETIKSW